MKTQIAPRREGASLRSVAICLAISAAIFLAGVWAGWYADAVAYAASPIRGAQGRALLPPHTIWLVAMVAPAFMGAYFGRRPRR